MLKSKYPFLKELNPQQFEAATTTEGPVLILAGAGSGKTKTIIARTAYLIMEKKISSENILVMTFTNKAAREMKERGSAMLDSFSSWDRVMPEFTTFHSWGARFLRNELITEEMFSALKLSRNFTIVDDSDQKNILKKIKEVVFPKPISDSFKVEKFLLTLGSIQNNLIPYDNLEETAELIEKLESNNKINLDQFFSTVTKGTFLGLANLYIKYKEELRKNNSVDFEDLINLPIKIIQNNKNIQNYLKDKYKYFMVDEFQDTNSSQLTLILSFLNKNNNLCVVGDDSQSIYGWRGANIEYILNFNKMLDNCKSINLSINYRSSKLIVKKANKLLTKSIERHKDKLDLEAFKPKEGIVQAKFFNHVKDESLNIAKRISFLTNEKGITPGDIAVLYRTGFINRDLEVELIRHNISYKIHRGKTLLERKVAKDFISYLKLIENEKNSLALFSVLSGGKILSDSRIFNFTKIAEESGESLLSFLKSGNYKLEPRVSKNTIEKVESFLNEMEMFTEFKKEGFQDFFERICLNNVIKNYYLSIIEKSESGETVPEQKLTEAHSNLNILNTIESLGRRYNSLEALLETISLEGEEEDCEENKVNLMTIHASKGLEFEVVFLLGASEGIFPGDRSKTIKEIEEERRLFYVAITRAKHILMISGSKEYFRRPDNKKLEISRFVSESKIKLV